jgi:hypothetical protein
MRSRWRQAFGIGCVIASLCPAPLGAQEAIPEEKPYYEGLEARKLSLPECLEIALTNQPRIHAELSSQESAQITARFLNKLAPLGKLQPALGARIDQANLGLTRAQAAVNQQVEETFYSVRRAYYTHIYARRVLDIAKPLEMAARRTENALLLKKRIGLLLEPVANLEKLEETMGKPFTDLVLGLPGPNLAQEPIIRRALRELAWTTANERILARLHFEHSQIKKKVNEAEAGARQSIALLGEDMGGFPRLGFQPLPSVNSLPMAGPRLDLNELLDLLDNNSGELIQIRAGRAATELEVRAQRQIAPLRGLVGTFASATDTKTVPLPTPERGEQFRPSVVGFETPTNLAGPRRVRIARANALADRARSVEESTRNLLRLQMRVTHEDYMDIQADIGNFEADAKAARPLFTQLTGGLLSLEESGLLASTGTLLADLEKAHFDRAVLLADLIRQTGGALQVDIDHWTNGSAPLESIVLP